MYLEKNQSVSENLDFFLLHRYEHIDASESLFQTCNALRVLMIYVLFTVMSFLGEATVGFYSFATSVPTVPHLLPPTAEMPAPTPYVPTASSMPAP